MTLKLNDIRASIVDTLVSHTELPIHLRAFSAWLGNDQHNISNCIAEAINSAGQTMHPEAVASIGYGVYGGYSDSEVSNKFENEINHLGGREFFAKGRVPRFEVDGVALLGITLGIVSLDCREQNQWMNDLLDQSIKELNADIWQQSLAIFARNILCSSTVPMPSIELEVALFSIGLGLEPNKLKREECWAKIINLNPHAFGPAYDAIRLRLFDHFISAQGQISISGNSQADLVSLLNNVNRSLRLWTYEEKQRTPKSKISKWDIENEYHVQNLLWVILSPIFGDLDDEENLPSIGQKNPRADLCIPSLRLIIEVKFMRNTGQRACAKIIDEISSDTGLYLSNTDKYDGIIAFIWDDCSQTEQYDELKSGIEKLNGVEAAIIISRPSKMKRVLN